MKICMLKSPKILAITLTSAVLLTCGAALTAADAQGKRDWAQWLGPNRDGVSSETGFLTTWPEGGPKRLWDKQVGIGYSSVSVANGKAYAVGNAKNQQNQDTDTLYCFDAESGKEIWRFPYPCARTGGNGTEGPRCTPVVDGDRVYMESVEGELFCLTAEGGKKVWSKNVKEYGGASGTWGFAGSPLVMGKMLVIDAGTVLALNKDTGKLIWSSQKYLPGYSSPVEFRMGPKACIATFPGTGLVILDPADGKELAQFPWKTEYDVNAVVPIISGDKVFISSDYSRGCALVEVTAEGAKKVYENKNVCAHFASCILWKGYLYGFDGNVTAQGRFRCLDFQSGQVKWSRSGMGQLIIADGKMIVLYIDGELALAEASPEGYKELAKAKVLGGTCWTIPVLANGRLYCRNHEGDLVCLDMKGK